MFIELVDVLRCPVPHEETWLVLAAEQTVDRHVMEGVLGCPVCHAEYRVERGTARFDIDVPQWSSAAVADESEAMRLAALLDLSGSRGFAILHGAHGVQASLLRELVEPQLLLVNPPQGIRMGNGISGLVTSRAIPVAAASARAAALDASASSELIQSAVDAVVAGGRIVGPTSFAVPATTTELARDARAWVAERNRAPTTSGVISLGRRQ